MSLEESNTIGVTVETILRESALVRAKAIEIIENYYPPDADRPETAALGQKLLAQAQANCATWRNEPNVVLVEFARLCRQEEERQIRESERKRRGY